MVPQGYGLNASVSSPSGAEIGCERVVVAIWSCARNRGTTHARPRTPCAADKSLPRQQCRTNAGLSRPAGMQPLGPGALGQISMMPPAILPAMPSASTICLALRPSAAPTPAAAPMAPKIAVG